MRIYWVVSAKNTVTCLKKQHGIVMQQSEAGKSIAFKVYTLTKTMKED